MMGAIDLLYPSQYAKNSISWGIPEANSTISGSVATILELTGILVGSGVGVGGRGVGVGGGSVGVGGARVGIGDSGVGVWVGPSGWLVGEDVGTGLLGSAVNRGSDVLSASDSVGRGLHGFSGVGGGG